MSGVDEATQQAPEQSPLLRHHSDFRRLWLGQSVSMLGSEMTVFALPLVAVVTLHANPVEVGYLVAASRLPYLLFGLVVGVWVDNRRKRRTMVLADLGRALLLGSVPLASALHHLTIVQLVLVAFAVGTLTLLFDVAYQTFIPSLVRSDQIVGANSTMEGSRSVAGVLGPAAGGPLVQAFTAPTAMFVDSMSFVVSVVSLLFIRTPDPAPAGAKRQTLQAAKEGLGVLLGEPRLRLLAVAGALNNFFVSMLFVVYTLYFIRVLGLRPVAIGVIVGLGMLGAVAASVVTKRLNAALGVGPSLITVSLVKAVGVALLAFARGDGVLSMLTLAIGFSGMFSGLQSFNISVVSLRQVITPREVLGRVNAANKFLVWVPYTVGALLAGPLGQAGLRLTVALTAAGLFVSVLPLLWAPVRTIGEPPTPEAAR
jgi:MFS family permease